MVDTSSVTRKLSGWPLARPEVPRRIRTPAHPALWRFQKARFLFEKNGSKGRSTIAICVGHSANRLPAQIN